MAKKKKAEKKTEPETKVVETITTSFDNDEQVEQKQETTRQARLLVLMSQLLTA